MKRFLASVRAFAEKYPVLALTVLAVLIRIGTFYPSVLTHDESTYIVIANEMLNGKVYWADLIDIKPIGIFLVYELMIILTDGSIFGIRALSAAAVGLTGGILYLLCKRATGNTRTGWAAGIGYILIYLHFLVLWCCAQYRNLLCPTLLRWLFTLHGTLSIAGTSTCWLVSWWVADL